MYPGWFTYLSEPLPKRFNFFFALLFPLTLAGPVRAQLLAADRPAPDSSARRSPRLAVVTLGTGAVYGGLLVAASQTWYQDMPRTRFHFFNDAREWQQVDKAGHFWGAFHQSRLMTGALRWAHVPERKAMWWGGLAGVLLQTPLELLDGYAAEYGASATDLAANTVGSAAALAQYLAWREIRIMTKYSFHRTRFAAYRPAVLGRTLAEQMLKDYNGQTYWLAVDVARFLPATSKYPKWLNVAVGYGTAEMVYNVAAMNQAAGFRAYRQFYLAPDLNLTGIKTRSKFLKTAFCVLSMIHFPAPALEYNARGKWRVHAWYF